MRNLPIILFMLFSMNLTAQPLTDIDKDNDGLIEVSDIETLNAMRYRLDGSGLKLNATAEAITTGCAVGGCKGYELTRDLDFNDVASYQNLANMKLWTTDAGWQPIGTAEQPFTAIFKTNNSSIPNTIFNLKISRADENNVGLFGHIGSTAEISGIGLLDATVEGNHQVGSLVGKNVGGQISNSYANGNVVGKGGEIGLLVGHSSGSITNSYANGEVSGEANGIGGLVGANHGEIANSYAMGSVVGNANNVGGLVGDNLQGTISNCYTTGSVSGSEDIGGLVGLSNLGTLISNYVSGKASGKRYIGGLVGSNIGGTITRSYWDKTASNLEGNTGGIGLLAGELQSANAQDEDLKKPYYKWSTAHWDFGTAEQYPILKYAAGSDLNNPVCGPEQTLPNCGTLLLGQHASLERILFLSDADLSPTFKPTELNYQLGITTGTKTLQLIPIASNPDSSINISRNGIVIDSDLANGTTSSVITLGENTEIVIEVSAANQRPAQYSLTTHYLQEITILGIPDKAIDEGESIMLDASQNLATADTLLSYRWTQSRGKTLFPSPDSEGAILWLHIPEDYVPATAEHANLGLTLEINNDKTTLTKNITLTIAKVDNGNIPVAPPTLTILEGTAPEIDLGKDPDGSGKDFSYQWQSRAPGQDAKWIDIDKATEKTHIISFLTESYTEYRVLISYTDGQGYKTLAASRAARYVPEIMILGSIKGLASEETIPTDAKPQRTSHSTTTTAFVCSTANIDQDDDGLIEICDLEGLNAIRYQLDGSGYNTSHSTRTKITAGCPEDGCKGYELIKDLDFNDDASYSSTPNKVIWTKGKGWEPIGYYEFYNSANNKPFTAIFEGNGHTISNLMIDRSNTSRVGLFGYATEGTINKVGLSNINIKGDWHVGGLVGDNRYGTITNSYATGAVEGDDLVGGLVGHSSGGTITNSYATGAVEGDNIVGGLVGVNSGTITNSYATGAVEGDWSVGGLVGVNSGTITNSYATGAVEGDSRVGGLVGANDGTIRNSYATGAVTGTGSYVGGLVGLAGWNQRGTIRNSYATGTVEGDSRVGGLVGANDGTIRNSGSKTTKELQSPTIPGSTSTEIYYDWSTADWDFGTSNQYPVLKYAKGPDDDNPACDEQGAREDLPECGSLLSPALRYGLSELRLVEGNLSPEFFVEVPNYAGTLISTTNIIQFKPTALNSTATISISVEGGVNEEIASGALSSDIMLSGTTKIIISVKNGGTTLPIEYTLHLNYHNFEGDIDIDDDGLIDINSLEELNAIRYQLDGTGYRDSENAPKITTGCPGNKCKGYELMKDLDFNDNAYSSTPNKVTWTTGKGWEPIGYYESYDSANKKPFTAIFEGNGHTISNLMIDRSANGVGLFGYIERGTINKVGLLSVKIKGMEYVGGLVGYANYRGTITNSYATGKVTGTGDYVGGLVGSNFDGTITNSYATGAVTGTGGLVGGLVGYSYGGTITNSYATGAVTGTGDYVGGLVGYSRDSDITNSYATGAVTGTGGLVGSLVGFSDLSTITNSYATGAVTGTGDYVGGLVGYSYGGTITNSYATGAVTGTGDYVGGLVGYSRDSDITNSYATGAVTGTGSYVGGLVGYNYNGTITNSYATGAVEGGDDHVGGLVGYNDRGTITNSYWDTQTSGQPRSAGGIGKTTEELQSLTPSTEIYGGWSATDWDFGTSNQYPALKYRDGTLLPGQYPSFLAELDLSDDITLSPNFHPEIFRYNVKVGATIDAIELTATTSDTNAYISIGSNIAGSIINNNQRTVENVPVGLTIAGDTIITIEVTEGEQRPTPYTITVSHNVPGNLAPPGIEVGAESVDEGQQVTVNLEYSGNCNLVNVKCRLEFPGYPSLSLDVLDKRRLQITIPDDFVEANKLTQKAVVVFAIRQGRDIASKETTFVVEKANNGGISIGQPTLVGSQLTAPKIDPSSDPDKGVQESSVRYQWWHGNNYIEGATSRTYTLGDVTGGEGHYVQISYTDGQGYCYGEGCTEKAINSEAIRGDIDVDDNGLIEIKYIDDLDAMRYVMDGSGYKRDMTATTSTVGCAEGGCKGYELIRDLDFKDADSYRNGKIRNDLTKDEGWQPIGDDSNSFSSTFKGNGKKILNLMINRHESEYIGLFSMINNSALIDGVNLHKVDIEGGGLVGALVGKNIGGTISNINVRGDSSTTSTIVGMDDQVGGLVGMNAGGSVINNVDLYRISIRGGKRVGGLAGMNQGIIINSRVSVDSDATTNQVEGERNRIGGLVGDNEGGRIINSYAVANIQGRETGKRIGYHVGGLVGRNTGQIINSYAYGSVAANRNVGGLVGQNNSGKIINSYATSRRVSGNGYVGGLVGRNNSGTITHSYWDETTSGIGTSVGGGVGKTTKRLQSPTTPGSTSTEIYYGWREEIWDFGSDEQYPALKYANAQCTGTDGTDYCGGLSPNKQTYVKSLCPLEDTPAHCNKLFTGQRLGLQSLQISGNAVLIETFKNTEYSYRVLVGNDVESIGITPTAADPTAEITLSTSDNSDEIVNQPSFEIKLAPGDSTTITIVVNTNTREVAYILEVVRWKVRITDGDVELDEGKSIELNAEVVSPSGPSFRTQQWVWTQIGNTLEYEMTTSHIIKLTGPADYVASDKLSVEVTSRVEGTLNIGSGSVKSSAKVELTINKENNGDITGPLDVPPKLVEATTQTDLHLVAPSLSAYLDRVNKTDPDNGINENTITYQWQSRTSDSDSWSDIGRNEKTYKIPHTSPFNTQYRVKLGYTDGQDYTVPEEDRLVSQAITVKHVDRDNNGLIDILSADALDAIRHQLDGSGYKKSSTATEIITAGCPMNNEQQRQCRGYELKAHIDLSGGEDWEPIGNANEFNAIFEGNHYTISNLTINRSVAGKNIGFFGRTAETAKIRNVGLLNVNITADGNNRVGGLVGFNKGTIEGSYVVSSGIRGGSHVGALVGATSGGVIKNNYATIKSLSENNSSVCKLIGEINGSMIEGNKMIGPCENNKLFECPAP